MHWGLCDTCSSNQTTGYNYSPCFILCFDICTIAPLYRYRNRHEVARKSIYFLLFRNFPETSPVTFQGTYPETFTETFQEPTQRLLQKLFQEPIRKLLQKHLQELLQDLSSDMSRSLSRNAITDMFTLTCAFLFSILKYTMFFENAI